MIFALSLLRTLSSLMVSVAFLMLGNSIFTTLLALRAKIEGYPNTLVGLMMSGYFLGFALGTFKSGPLINRVGHIRAFSALAAVASICSLLVLLINNPWVWVGLRVMMGAAMAGLFIVVESWLNNRATNESRGVLMSIYIMIGYAASVLGQQSLNIGNPGGSELFLLVGMLLSLSLVPVALTRATHPDPVDSPHVDLKRLAATSPTAVAGCFVAGLIGGAWWGMGPVYASEIGFTTQQIAGFMTAALVGGLILQLPVGRLSDRFDRRSVLFWAAVLQAVPMVLLGLGQLLHLWIIMAAAAAAYGLASTLYPLSVAYANDYLDPPDVVSASAGFVLFYAAGAIAGPLISSTLMTVVGVSGLFIHTLTMVTALALFIQLRMRVRQWIPVVGKEPYVLQPEAQAPGVVSELDPRAEVDPYYDEGPDTIETGHDPELATLRSRPENESPTEESQRQQTQKDSTPG